MLLATFPLTCYSGMCVCWRHAFCHSLTHTQTHTCKLFLLLTGRAVMSVWFPFCVPVNVVKDGFCLSGTEIRTEADKKKEVVWSSLFPLCVS